MIYNLNRMAKQNSGDRRGPRRANRGGFRNRKDSRNVQTSLIVGGSK